MSRDDAVRIMADNNQKTLTLLGVLHPVGMRQRRFLKNLLLSNIFRDETGKERFSILRHIERSSSTWWHKRGASYLGMIGSWRAVPFAGSLKIPPYRILTG
jgi:hypothetical protein